jgi:hypothetical protein
MKGLPAIVSSVSVFRQLTPSVQNRNRRCSHRRSAVQGARFTLLLPVATDEQRASTTRTAPHSDTRRLLDVVFGRLRAGAGYTFTPTVEWAAK